MVARRRRCFGLASRGDVSLRQRKWNRAHGQKQKQIKCDSKKMRLNSSVNLALHGGLSFLRLRVDVVALVRPFYAGLPQKINTF